MFQQEEIENNNSENNIIRVKLFECHITYMPFGQLLTRQEFFDLMVRLYPDGCDDCDIDFYNDFFRECQSTVWKDYGLNLFTWQYGDHENGEEDKAFKMFIIGRLTEKELEDALKDERIDNKLMDVFTDIQQFELYGPEDESDDESDNFPYL